VNNAFERALVFMHKMPRIWIDYCAFLVDQRKITRTRRVLDRALRALPITQHDRIWPLYIRGAIHQLLNIILKLGLPVSTLPCVVKVKNYS
jgi:hypothetical protein